jgi:hypothetical protein
MAKRIVRRLGAVLLLATALIAAGVAGASYWLSPAHAERAKVTVVGTSAPWAVDDPTWLDEDTVVFTGFPGDVPLTPNYPPPRKVYVWKIGGEAEVYPTRPPGREVGYACAEHGLIYYDFKRAYDPKRGADQLPTEGMGGPPGQEVPRFPPGPSFTSPVNSIQLSRRPSCDRYVDPRMNGRWWLPNASRSTYLDFGSLADSYADLGNTRSVSLESASGADRRSLSIPDFKATPADTLTPAWDDSFVLWNGRDSFSLERETWPSIPVFRISKSGEVTVTRLVNTPALWSSALVAYRDGYLAVTSAAGDPDKAGLFVVDEERATRVYKGFVGGAGISPSGCRVAFVDSMVNGRPSYGGHLKIIELCRT